MNEAKSHVLEFHRDITLDSHIVCSTYVAAEKLLKVTSMLDAAFVNPRIKGLDF